MIIARKITATVLAAGLAYSGTAVAHAQSSSSRSVSSLGSFSSSRGPGPTDTEEQRIVLRELYIDHYRESGHAVTPDANEVAQEVALIIAEGRGQEHVHQLCGEDEAACSYQVVPNISLEDRIESLSEREPGTYDLGTTVGVGVAGVGADTVAGGGRDTYVVIFDAEKI